MKYIIYELIQPSHLKESVQDGYYIKTVYRNVLEELDVPKVESKHDSMESALSEINSNKELLKHLTLTVLPILSINWEGDIT